MSKIPLDEVENFIEEEIDDENSVEYRRKLRKEKKEITSKKIRFFSREYMQE
jgi:hypothetical protein